MYDFVGIIVSTGIGLVIGGTLEAFTGVFASAGNRMIIFIEHHDGKILAYIRRNLNMEVQ